MQSRHSREIRRAQTEQRTRRPVLLHDQLLGLLTPHALSTRWLALKPDKSGPLRQQAPPHLSSLSSEVPYTPLLSQSVFVCLASPHASATVVNGPTSVQGRGRGSGRAGSLASSDQCEKLRLIPPSFRTPLHPGRCAFIPSSQSQRHK